MAAHLRRIYLSSKKRESALNGEPSLFVQITFLAVLSSRFGQGARSAEVLKSNVTPVEHVIFS